MTPDVANASGTRVVEGYFGPPGRRLMGWLHLPAAGAKTHSTGVVVCAPLGYDALCAHRSLRHFAEVSAALGYPALRFDYDGTGNSAGNADDPERWTAWKGSIHDAIRSVQKSAGVERVVLLGVGLGATLAATLGAALSEVAGVAAIAPVVKGRSWLREMRALKGVMGRAEPPPEVALPEGVEESVGVILTADARAALEQVDLVEQSRGGATEWLVLDRDDRASSQGWIEALERAGKSVEYATPSGYVQMMQDPHESEVPSDMLAHFTAWISSRFPELQRAGGTATLDAGPALVAPGVEEQPVRIGDSPALFGVVTRPAKSRPSRAVLLLNAGANTHIGNGRMYVEYARRLAAQGWLVLRYDVSGIGESPVHAGRHENEVYTSMAVPDLRRAVAFLRGELGVTHVEAAGLCSGAYHALRGAVEGVALNGITVINPLTFRWRDGMSLKYPPFVVVQTAAQYKRSMRDWRKWLKVARGGVDLRMAAAVTASRVQERARVVVRDARRAAGVPAPYDLGSELQDIAKRGIAIRFVFSLGDPGESLLRSGAGSALSSLARSGKLSIAHLPGCDHSLSMSWMRRLLWRELDRALGAS